jgi:hypothetical protein
MANVLFVLGYLNLVDETPGRLVLGHWEAWAGVAGRIASPPGLAPRPTWCLLELEVLRVPGRCWLLLP